MSEHEEAVLQSGERIAAAHSRTRELASGDRHLLSARRKDWPLQARAGGGGYRYEGMIVAEDRWHSVLFLFQKNVSCMCICLVLVHTCCMYVCGVDDERTRIETRDGKLPPLTRKGTLQRARRDVFSVAVSLMFAKGRCGLRLDWKGEGGRKSGGNRSWFNDSVGQAQWYQVDVGDAADTDTPTSILGIIHGWIQPTRPAQRGMAGNGGRKRTGRTKTGIRSF